MPLNTLKTLEICCRQNVGFASAKRMAKCMANRQSAPALPAFAIAGETPPERQRNCYCDRQLNTELAIAARQQRGQMQGQFESAVEWLTPICRHIVKDRKLNFPEMNPWEPILQLKFHVLPKGSGFEISDHYAFELLRLASELPGAFDLARKICAQNLMAEMPIPKPLRVFAAECLIGMVRRPKGKKSDKTWLSNQYKYTLIRSAVRRFQLSMTRGDNNPSTSACDAVSLAFKAAGHEIDYFSLKRLCVEARYTVMRAENELWAQDAVNLSREVLTQEYGVPEFFFHVSDGVSNSDTPNAK